MFQGECLAKRDVKKVSVLKNHLKNPKKTKKVDKKKENEFAYLTSKRGHTLTEVTMSKSMSQPKELHESVVGFE